MEDMNITFEDLPKAMSWMMDKLNKLDSKIDGLNNIPQVRPADQWMNLKELCEYLPSHPAEHECEKNSGADVHRGNVLSFVW